MCRLPRQVSDTATLCLTLSSILVCDERCARLSCLEDGRQPRGLSCNFARVDDLPAFERSVIASCVGMVRYVYKGVRSGYARLCLVLHRKHHE